MASVSAGLSSYSTARTTDISPGSAQGPLFGLSLCVILGYGAESCRKIVRRLLGDHFLP